MTVKHIFIIIGVIVLLVLLYSFTSAKGTSGHGPTGVFTGSLVSAAPKEEFTNTYFSIDPTSSITSYYLTYTPKGGLMTTQKSTPTTSQSEQISVEDYKRFINNFPNGLAPGNVLNDYKG